MCSTSCSGSRWNKASEGPRSCSPLISQCPSLCDLPSPSFNFSCSTLFLGPRGLAAPLRSWHLCFWCLGGSSRWPCDELHHPLRSLLQGCPQSHLPDLTVETAAVLPSCSVLHSFRALLSHSVSRTHWNTTPRGPGSWQVLITSIE